MEKGKFIVLEGIDGSGKSTQIEILAEELKKRGEKVYITREPSDRPIGKLIRKILRKEIKTSNDTLAGLYAADRIDHLDNKEDGMLMKLEKGITVLCDRYYLSSLAYNSLNSPMSWVLSLNQKCIDTLRPDLIIYLDIPVKESLRRIAKGRESTDLFEKEDILNQVKSNYSKAMDLLPEENIKIVNADQDPELIKAEIWTAVQKHLY